MGFNVYLGPLVQADGATLISIISLVDVDVGSFSSYIYLPTPWAKHTKTTVRGAPSLENRSCSKLDFSPPSLAVAAALLVAVPSSCTSSFFYSSLELFIHEDTPPLPLAPPVASPRFATPLPRFESRKLSSIRRAQCRCRAFSDRVEPLGNFPVIHAISLLID